MYYDVIRLNALLTINSQASILLKKSLLFIGLALAASQTLEFHYCFEFMYLSLNHKLNSKASKIVLLAD